MESVEDSVWRGAVALCLEREGLLRPFYAVVPRVSYLSAVVPSALRQFQEEVGEELEAGDIVAGDVVFSKSQWQSLPLGVLFDSCGSCLPWALKLVRTTGSASIASASSSFFHSLKQATHLETGTARPALLQPRVDQELCWEAIIKGDRSAYVSRELASPTDERLRHVPLRIIIPPCRSLQLPHAAYDAEGKRSLRKAVFCETILEATESFLASAAPDSFDFIAHGITLPHDLPLIDAWKALRHPDHFLYLTVRRRTTS